MTETATVGAHTWPALDTPTPGSRLPLDPTPCPGCGSCRGALVYEVYGLPVCGGLLTADPESAREVPRGDIRLVLCSDCGYLANRAYDPERMALVDCPDGFPSQWDVPGPPENDVALRHVLERSPEPLAFLRRLRAALADRPGARIRVELPDADRILTRAAFWEVSYEHCGYFTSDIVETLFRAAGFTVTSLTRFEGERLLITALPADNHTSTPPAVAESRIRALGDAAARFRAAVGNGIVRWRRALTKLADSGRDVVLWGATPRASSFLGAMGPRAWAVSRVVDAARRRAGKYLVGTGHPVVTPEELSQQPPDVVIALGSPEQAGITAALQRLAIPATVLGA